MFKNIMVNNPICSQFNRHSWKSSRGLGRGLCPFERIGPEKPLLIVEGDDRGDLALTKCFFRSLFLVGAGFTKGI